MHDSDPDSVKIPKSPTNGSEYYHMGSRHISTRKRGRCVILNYEIFLDIENYSTRTGTQHDVKKLKETFEKQNFEVKIYQDMSEKGTSLVLRFESQFDHSEYFCFVLCILSHGVPNRFVCIDTGTKKHKGILYKSLYEQFDGINCPSLVGKPKLFFIQACRGSKKDPGVCLNASTNLGSDAKSQLYLMPDNVYTIPITADQLAFYSSYLGYSTLRDPNTGTRFMQDLCRLLDEYADQEDLLSIITKIAKSVSESEIKQIDTDDYGKVLSKSRVKQMPMHFSTLVKKVQF